MRGPWLSFGSLMVSAVSWLIWAATWTDDDWEGPVPSQGVLLVSDAEACSWCNWWTIPSLLTGPCLVGTAEVQCDSLRFLVQTVHPAAWTIGSCAAKWLAVSAGQEEPWFVIFADFRGVSSSTLAFQATSMTTPNAELGRDAPYGCNRYK